MIRPATPDDAPAVARVFGDSRAEAMPWLPVLHTPEEDLAWFTKQLAGEAYVWDEGGILGYAVLNGDELHDLYIAPEAQGRGIGSALFARVQEARPAGFHLWAFRDNTRARGFYERRGCVVVRATDGDNEEGLPDVMYEWRPTGAGAAA